MPTSGSLLKTLRETGRDRALFCSWAGTSRYTHGLKISDHLSRVVHPNLAW